MTIYGLDFSHYDAVPDGARVVSEGFSFMTHKAGGDKDDAELAAWWRALKPYRGKVLLGAYWVLYPGSPASRADAFLARLDSQCPGWRDGPFILQLDCEDWKGDGTTKPHLSDIRAACDRLKAKMPKLRPIVYASAGQYGNTLTGLGYPLWNARYPVNAVSVASGVYALTGGDSGKGWAAYSGQTPAIWQFSSSATALGQTTCDANAFRGTLKQLTALVAPGWELNTMDLKDKVGSDVYPSRTVEDFFKDFWGMRDNLVVGPSKTPALPINSPLAKLIAVPGQLAALQAQIGKLTVPSAQENAQAVLDALGAESLEDAASALRAVLGDERTAQLAVLLSSPTA